MFDIIDENPLNGAADVPEDQIAVFTVDNSSEGLLGSPWTGGVFFVVRESAPEEPLLVFSPFLYSGSITQVSPLEYAVTTAEGFNVNFELLGNLGLFSDGCNKKDNWLKDGSFPPGEGLSIINHRLRISDAGSYTLKPAYLQEEPGTSPWRFSVKVLPQAWSGVEGLIALVLVNWDYALSGIGTLYTVSAGLGEDGVGNKYIYGRSEGAWDVRPFEWTTGVEYAVSLELSDGKIIWNIDAESGELAVPASMAGHLPTAFLAAESTGVVMTVDFDTFETTQVLRQSLKFTVDPDGGFGTWPHDKIIFIPYNSGLEYFFTVGDAPKPDYHTFFNLQTLEVCGGYTDPIGALGYGPRQSSRSRSGHRRHR